jgi:integrase
VAQVVARYLEERTPHLSVRQSAHYLNVGGILVSLFGELPIVSFGAEEMREFRASLLARTNQHKEGGCTRLVREALTNGPRPSIQVEAQALAAGYCREVYRSARVRLGVQSKKVGKGWISWLPPGKCIPPPLTGLSQTYIKALLGIVRTMFRRLASEGIVTTEQAAEVAAVRNPEQGQARQTEGRLPPHPDHVEQVQQVLTPDYACAVLKLHRVTGARPGELCALTRDEVSTGADDPVTLYVKGHQLRVTAPPGCWLFAPAAHKARRHRKPRVILMGPTAQEILRPWLATGFGMTVSAYRQAMSG